MFDGFLFGFLFVSECQTDFFWEILPTLLYIFFFSEEGFWTVTSAISRAQRPTTARQPEAVEDPFGSGSTIPGTYNKTGLVKGNNRLKPVVPVVFFLFDPEPFLKVL